MRFLTILSLLLFLHISAVAQEPKTERTQNPPRQQNKAMEAVAISEEEEREIQNLLSITAERNQEYREAVLVLQAAQQAELAARAKRGEVAQARLALFYKVCARLKLDPEKYEWAPDGRSIQLNPPKQSTNTGSNSKEND